MTNEYEQRAAQVLSQVLGGQVTWRDPGGGPGSTHDFDVRCPNGTTVAVEVTSVTDPEAEAFWRAVSQANWQSTRLQRSWLLDVETGANVRALQGQVEPLLAQLEKQRIWCFDAESPEAEAHALRRLGVRSGCPLDWPTPHYVYITGGNGGAIDPEFPRMAVEAVAWARDNRDKLAGASPAERHLFVWIRPLSHQAFASMRAWRITPPRCCCLPPEVDLLWVGRSCGTDESGTIVAEDLWRFTRSSGWGRIRASGG